MGDVHARRGDSRVKGKPKRPSRMGVGAGPQPAQRSGTALLLPVERTTGPRHAPLQLCTACYQPTSRLGRIVDFDL